MARNSTRKRNRFQPPKPSPTTALKRVHSFHDRVISLFQTLKRFTAADFLGKFPTCNPLEFGYCSLDHLFSFLGCSSEGNYYTYNELLATKMKARIVAKKLRKFSKEEFLRSFKSTFVTKKICSRTRGFRSVEALLSSIPGLVSIGADMYEMRSNTGISDALPISKNGKMKEDTKAKRAKKSLSVQNSAETMAGNGAGDHYELPKFKQDKAWLRRQAFFHMQVDSLFRTLQRFTAADFLSRFPKCKPLRYGYRSLDHLFSFRGCLSDGNYYIYGERSATKMKARIVVTKLRKFSKEEFTSNFKNFFVAKKVCKKGCGFDTVAELLKSIPDVISVGGDKYEMRSNTRKSDDLSIPKEGKVKEDTKAKRAKKSLSVQNSAETMAGNGSGDHYELPKFNQNKAWLHKLATFHSRVDSLFRTLERFTAADFLSRFPKCKPVRYGYRSLEHLFTFRGCLSDGNYYTYGVRSATKLKARIVATKLGRFNEYQFLQTFKMFYVTKNPLRNSSVAALLRSIPDLISVGDEYEMQTGADVLPIAEEGKGKHARISTEEQEGPLMRISTEEAILGNRAGHCYELPEFNKDAETLARMARCHHTVDALFCSLRRFTEKTFLRKNTGYKKFKPQTWGYQSFDHLFLMRGCVPDGIHYTYDERTATERKARILAANLQKFSYAEFCDNFRKFFTTDETVIRRLGFDSLQSLLGSIPGLVSTGANQYEMRSGEPEKPKLSRRNKRNLSDVEPQESQGEPASKRSKNEPEIPVGEDLPQNSSGKSGKKSKKKKADKGVKTVQKKAKSKGKVKSSKTTRSLALESAKKKKKVVKKRMKSAGGESTSGVGLQGSDEVPGGIGEGESGEIVQQKLKKAEQRLKKVERELIEAKIQLRKRDPGEVVPPSDAFGQGLVQEQWRNGQMPSSIGQLQQMMYHGAPGGYGGHVTPMFPGFLPPPLPLFPPLHAEMNNTPPLSLPPAGSTNTPGTPTPRNDPDPSMNSNEGVHQGQWVDGQMQPMMMHQGFAAGPVPAQIPGFGHFPPHPMTPGFPPHADATPAHLLGSMVSSVVTSALERSTDPRELTNQLFDTIFGKQRQE